MKYIVHYGYYECDGLKIFDSLEKAKSFLDKEKRDRFVVSDWGWFYNIYEASSFELVESK